jgi:hypothetical protein
MKHMAVVKRNPKKKRGALRAALFFLGFDFVLTQVTAAIKEAIASLSNCTYFFRMKF